MVDGDTPTLPRLERSSALVRRPFFDGPMGYPPPPPRYVPPSASKQAPCQFVPYKIFAICSEPTKPRTKLEINLNPFTPLKSSSKVLKVSKVSLKVFRFGDFVRKFDS